MMEPNDYWPHAISANCAVSLLHAFNEAKNNADNRPRVGAARAGAFVKLKVLRGGQFGLSKELAWPCNGCHYEYKMLGVMGPR